MKCRSVRWRAGKWRLLPIKAQVLAEGRVLGLDAEGAVMFDVDVGLSRYLLCTGVDSAHVGKQHVCFLSLGRKTTIS
jgi:hypothetical protein